MTLLYCIKFENLTGDLIDNYFFKAKYMLFLKLVV